MPTVHWKKSELPFSRHLILYAVLLRMLLLAFSVWQDYTGWPDGQLRFTDVDYDVFTDAAKAMVDGKDIYEARPTYRYSPLIALLLSPGHFLASKLRLSEESWGASLLEFAAFLFGKVVFIIADILCALLQRKIMLLETKKYAASINIGVRSSSTISWLVGVFWLFNPITAAVSVRGNAESILGFVNLACLLCVLNRRVLPAGLLFGLAIHLKLYPVIYAPVIYLMLCEDRLHLSCTGPAKGRLARIVSALLPITLNLWVFALATLVSLVGLTTVGYVAYGWMFLQNAYFYHFTRVDFWHNFAPHFYPIYLFEGVLANPSNGSSIFDATLFPLNVLPLSMVQCFYQPENLKLAYSLFKGAIMIPPLILIPVLSWKHYRQPSFAWFSITFAFVAFNKVCTSQYFLWWLVLLPPALAHIRLPVTPSGILPASLINRLSAIGLHPSAVNRCFALHALWLVGQGAWLSMAYSHEMQNDENWGNRFRWLSLWSASCIFFFINIVILSLLIRWVRPHTITKRQRSRKNSHGDLIENKDEANIVMDTSNTRLRQRKLYSKAAAF